MTTTASSSAADNTLAALKLPPHSLEAEQAVLGGLMLDEQSWDRVSDRVVEADFYRRDHRLIFQAISLLAAEGSPRDALTVAETLTRLGELETAGGMAYLGELVRNTPSATNIAAYGDIVRERSVLRQLIRISNEVSDTAFQPQGATAQAILDEAERKIFAIAEQQQKAGGPQALKPLLAKALDRIDRLFQSDEAITGLSTGFNDLDDRTSGLQKGDLVIVAARPSMGKTTFAMNLVENAMLRSGLPTLVFSMEMPAEQIVMRMLSSLGRIDQTRVRSGKLEEDDWPRLTSTMTLLAEQKLLVDDTPSLSPNDVRTRARRVAREQGPLGLIMVDYLQLMRVPGLENNRVNEISEISRSLKALAKEMECPVIALSQLNRSLEQRPNKRPVMSDLRESGAIEQDADVIMFIYRDEVYNPESPDKGTAEIIIDCPPSSASPTRVRHARHLAEPQPASPEQQHRGAAPAHAGQPLAGHGQGRCLRPRRCRPRALAGGPGRRFRRGLPGRGAGVARSGHQRADHGARGRVLGARAGPGAPGRAGYRGAQPGAAGAHGAGAGRPCRARVAEDQHRHEPSRLPSGRGAQGLARPEPARRHQRSGAGHALRQCRYPRLRPDRAAARPLPRPAGSAGRRAGRAGAGQPRQLGGHPGLAGGRRQLDAPGHRALWQLALRAPVGRLFRPAAGHDPARPPDRGARSARGRKRGLWRGLDGIAGDSHRRGQHRLWRRLSAPCAQRHAGAGQRPALPARRPCLHGYDHRRPRRGAGATRRRGRALGGRPAGRRGRRRRRHHQLRAVLPPDAARAARGRCRLRLIAGGPEAPGRYKHSV
ncbi:UNVERIFIED_CONTAM: dnaB [Trichonephila clavipes]